MTTVQKWEVGASQVQHRRPGPLSKSCTNPLLLGYDYCLKVENGCKPGVTPTGMTTQSIGGVFTRIMSSSCYVLGGYLVVQHAARKEAKSSVWTPAAFSTMSTHAKPQSLRINGHISSDGKGDAALPDAPLC